MPNNRSSQLWTLLLTLAILALLVYLGTHRPPARQRARQPVPAHRGPQRPADCGVLGIRCASAYFAQWQPPPPRSCRTRVERGHLLPDPLCTPGGANPSINAETIREPGFSTRCDRNCAESEAEKHVAYRWYGIPAPHENSGENQVCELDHLVPLELGGADGMGNLWPECGPDGVPLDDREFKMKDRVENYLAEQVRAGRMPLAEAQQGIARDWTVYLSAATR